VPRSRAAPLSDPVGVAQRVGTVDRADEAHTTQLQQAPLPNCAGVRWLSY